MTSSQIRQSFLDFFRSKQHTIVPSSSLMPDAPNLLFTNAGMNQFVPIFLGERRADVDKWAGVVPGLPTRAADTQKCIRAGGKHNDLDDVGLDTYHHTFFEMLGNWSFGDYFKKESIEWGWELLTNVWKFPPQRLYATVYSPDKSKGDPSDFDQEAHDIWARLFREAGLDPTVHIVNGGKKDNFWMMGETGPCGPCSEIHVDLTPAGDTRGELVNKGDARCIEIWNHVFIQFNANPDGTFSPLPAKHVDTGMGFERVTSIIQCTRGFTDFANARISNYETDIFRPIFDELEKMSGKKYCNTLPPRTSGESREQIREIVTAIQIGKVLTYGDVGALCVPSISGQAASSSIRSQENEIAWWRVVNAAGELPVEHRDAGQAVEQRAKLKAEGVDFVGDNVDLSKSRFETQQWQVDIAFRVIADHIRTLSFAIADGIQPGNTDRNYVLRRILRRAVSYGRTLGFHEPFFYKLVDVLAATMGDVFPEIRTRKQHVKDVLKLEEEAFNKTLDEGMAIFEGACGAVEEVKVFLSKVPSKLRRVREELDLIRDAFQVPSKYSENKMLKDVESAHSWFSGEVWSGLGRILVFGTAGVDLQRAAGGIADDDKRTLFMRYHGASMVINVLDEPWKALCNAATREFAELTEAINEPQSFEMHSSRIRTELDRIEREFLIVMPDTKAFPSAVAFRLHDTYGFPLDLTELKARERGLTVDVAGFNALMEEQKSRARAAQKKDVISLSELETKEATTFDGFKNRYAHAKVLEVVAIKDKTAVILNRSPFYAEMGGQVGDTGELRSPTQSWQVVNTQKSGNVWLHFVEGSDAPPVGGSVDGFVNPVRRSAIERHHTVTHILHWALHEVVSHEASQKGSFVGPDKLTFDFNSAPLTAQQLSDIERLVNERVVENALVDAKEFPFAEVKGRKDVMQFFGDKYGDVVRVIQIGGTRNHAALNGYSMELCGGTHTRATGEIGLFRIVSENAIASGVRRIEAVAGLTAFDAMRLDRELIKTVAGKVSSPIHELEKKIESVLAHQKELEKLLKTSIARNAAQTAAWLLTRVQEINGIPLITQGFPDGDADYLQAVVDALKSHFKGVVVLGGAANASVTLVASVSSDFTAKAQAGKIIQAIAPIVGGKGGGKPDSARGGGKDASKLDEALARVKSLLG